MGVSEDEVGITVFTNECAGFKGILKRRYSDFVVNEIDLEGKEVRLTSLDVPTSTTDDAAGENAEAWPTDPAAALDSVVQRFEGLVGKEQAAKMQAFLKRCMEYKESLEKAKKNGSRWGNLPPEPITLEPIADKDKRTAVHKLFKALPPNLPALATSTVAAPAAEGGAKEEGEGQGRKGKPAALQCIQVAVDRGGGRRDRGQKRKRDEGPTWEGGSMKFLKFVLYKENTDMQQALGTVGRLLRLHHKVFAVAGTKDKRGVTSQQVTALRVPPQRLAGLNACLRGISLGNFSYCQEPLRLGDQSGNHFRLVLRNVEAESEEAVAAAAEGLRRTGFVNYYGLQRFGTGAVPTHRVGAALLQGKWEEAVRLLLTPKDDSRQEIMDACNAYLEDGDVEHALRLMPKFLVAEPAILQGLKQCGSKSFLDALMRIPRNVRNMYIHAYQSYLWNAAASHRIKALGADKAVQGDLVLPRAAAAAARARNKGKGQSSGALAAEGGEPAAAEAEAGAGAELAEEEEVVCEAATGADAQVHVVTAEEGAAGAYSIEDVVLPLPGSQIRYPEHDTAALYRTLAAQDGVSLDSCPHGARDFSMAQLPGAYRYVLHRPADLEYEILRYSDPDADLAVTDLMALQGRKLKPLPADGRLLGLRLSFSLPTASYATMLIRELTKQDTSVAHHTALTQEQQAQNE